MVWNFFHQTIKLSSVIGVVLRRKMVVRHRNSFATSLFSIENSRFVSPFFRGSLITTETRSTWASGVPVAGLKPACQLLNGVDWFISGFLFHSGEIKHSV